MEVEGSKDSEVLGFDKGFHGLCRPEAQNEVSCVFNLLTLFTNILQLSVSHGFILKEHQRRLLCESGKVGKIIEGERRQRLENVNLFCFDMVVAKVLNCIHSSFFLRANAHFTL